MIQGILKIHCETKNGNSRQKRHLLTYKMYPKRTQVLYVIDTSLQEISHGVEMNQRFVEIFTGEGEHPQWKE